MNVCVEALAHARLSCMYLRLLAIACTIMIKSGQVLRIDATWSDLDCIRCFDNGLECLCFTLPNLGFALHVVPGTKGLLAHVHWQDIQWLVAP